VVLTQQVPCLVTRQLTNPPALLLALEYVDTVRLKVDFHLLVSHLKAMVKCRVALADTVMIRTRPEVGAKLALPDFRETPRLAPTTDLQGISYDREQKLWCTRASLFYSYFG